MKKVIISLIVLVLMAGMLFALTGREILKKMDQNENFKTMSFTATMEIHKGKKVRVKKMKGFVEGTKKSIMEFINKEDRGTKYLKLKKELWIYFPDEEETVKISGHMLKKGMMGSDVSYEDALESDELYKKYDIKITGEESYKGKPCHVVTLKAKVKDVPYAKRRIWVDKQDFIGWKEEMYAKSGKLLKVAYVNKVRKIGNMNFAVDSVIESKVRKNRKTRFILGKVELNVSLKPGIFTKRYLNK